MLKADRKGCALGIGFIMQGGVVLRSDFFTDRQTQPGAGIFGCVKGGADFFRYIRVNSYTFIRHFQDNFAIKARVCFYRFDRCK